MPAVAGWAEVRQAYDHRGVSYSEIRRPDPRIAALIDDALGDRLAEAPRASPARPL